MISILGNNDGPTQLQLATFHVGEMLLGLPIEYVQEINRLLRTTHMPHAPRFVRGVINLRGDVATVIDLRRVLGLPEAEITPNSRNLIVRFDGELIGLHVDRVADIIIIPSDAVQAPPTVGHCNARHIQGVYHTENGILVILDIHAVLTDDQPAVRQAE